MKTIPRLQSCVCLLILLRSLALAQEPVERSPFDPAPSEPPASVENPSIEGGSGEEIFGKDRDPTLARIPSDRGKQLRVPLRLRLETWEAPAIEVAKRLDDLQGAERLAAMRAECLSGAGGVSLVHSPVTTIDSSTQMLAESITERIYPTEYEPPSLPCAPMTPTEKEPAPKSLPEWMEQLMTGAVPTSFETRNTGSSLNAVAQAVAVEEKSWDVAVSFEVIGYPGTDSYGEKSLEITMPVISSFRTGGLMRLKEGQWRLLSVMEPPRGIDGKPSDKRWVTLVRLDRED